MSSHTDFVSKGGGAMFLMYLIIFIIWVMLAVVTSIIKFIKKGKAWLMYTIKLPKPTV